MATSFIRLSAIASNRRHRRRMIGMVVSLGMLVVIALGAIFIARLEANSDLHAVSTSDKPEQQAETPGL